MKKVFDKILIFEIILLVSLLFNSFVFKIANTYEIVGVLVVFLVASIIMLGFEKNNYRNKKDILITILISLLIYYFVTYFLGIFFGFVRNGYSLSIINIIKNTFPILLLIISSELLRYTILSKIKHDSIHISLCIIIFILIDINASIYMYDINTYAGLTKMLCLTLFPSVTKNILLTYVTSKVGYTNSVVYRIITELNIYLLPIFPNFGEYINTTIITVLPVLILFKINNMFNYFEMRKIKSSKYNKKKLILYSVITFSLLIIVTLTSGIFKYQALAIGSNSMSPKIKMGDVVIVRKASLYDIGKIKKGDILVYTHDNKIIVHRVVKVINLNNEFSFITKGDNNDNNDAWLIKKDDIIGTANLKIKYIGMPTVMLNELLNK